MPSIEALIGAPDCRRRRLLTGGKSLRMIRRWILMRWLWLRHG
jgi:hypothetical protein